MRSHRKSRTAASFVCACLMGSPGYVLAQDKPATPVVEPTESTLPGSAAVPLSPDDPYLRLPGSSVREDPIMEKYRRTSRGLGQTDRGETVMQRKRTGYDAQGLPVGSFTFFPAVTTSGTATNNVFRQSDERADAFFTGRFEGVLRSDWARHYASLDGMIEKDLHARFSTENNFNYRARASGRLDIFEMDRITLEAIQERTTQDRGNTGDILTTRRPIANDFTTVSLGGKFGGRSRLQAQAEIAYGHRQYHRAESLDGVTLDQSFRNFNDYRITGQLGYRFGALSTVFISGAHTWRRLPNPGLVDRDVDIIEFLGGVEGEITPVIRGRLGGGYIRANFKAPTIKSQGGVAVDARLDFLVTELTTVRVSARRELRNVAGVNSSAAIATFARLGLDHELFRNVIISPGVSYEVANYVDNDRQAKLVSLDLGGRWLINQRLRVNALGQFRKRDATGFDTNRDYSALSFTAGVTFQL